MSRVKKQLPGKRSIADCDEGSGGKNNDGADEFISINHERNEALVFKNVCSNNQATVPTMKVEAEV